MNENTIVVVLMTANWPDIEFPIIMIIILSKHTPVVIKHNYVIELHIERLYIVLMKDFN